MASLLPPNATQAERDIEAATARLEAVPTPLRQLWNPNTCPVALLPWLAWALSLDVWNANWSEAIKRERIRTAIAIQRRKGTARSVREVVQSFGGTIAIREWWQMDPPGEPHTFELLLFLNGVGGAPATAEFVNDVMAEVHRTKPARSHFTFTQGLTASAGIRLVAAARPAVFARLRAVAPAAS